MSVKVLTIGDPHTATRNISSRRDDYFETCRAKLNSVLKYAVSEKVDLVAIPGDFFHDKEESKIGYKLIHLWFKFLRICEKHKIVVVAVPGNHDMLFHRQDISDRPLALLSQRENFILVNNSPYFLSKEDIKLVVSGSSFQFGGDRGELKEKQQYFPQSFKDSNFHIHLTHGSLIPVSMVQDFQFMDYTILEELLGSNPAWDLLINGHIHWIGKDCIKQKLNKFAVNSGSLTRGSLKMENLKRGVQAILIEILNVNGEITPLFTQLTIPHQPAEVIFDVNAYLETKKEDKDIAMFMDMLKETTLSEESSNSNLEKLVQQSSVSEEVKAKALEYIAKLSV